MPEGDTIFKAAAQLQTALAGRRIGRFFSPLPKLKEVDLEGREVTRVVAHGKNLVITLDDGRAIVTHLGMDGSWTLRDKQRLSPEELERFARPPHSLNPVFTLSIENEAYIAICQRAALVELASERDVARRLATLGPDVLSDDFDAARVRENLRRRPELPIGEAILLQSLLAGVGNVFKSEILFLEKVSPFALVNELDDAKLDSIIERARVLLNKNRAPGPRRTQFSSFTRMRHYVYERSGQHCLKCDATIQMRRQGSQLRSTYYCPECQGVK